MGRREVRAKTRNVMLTNNNKFEWKTDAELNYRIQKANQIYCQIVGLGVTCSSRDPRFVGSNPTEVDNFFQDVKILNTSL